MQRYIVPFSSDKVIGTLAFVQQLRALTCEPWNYAMPHIIRNDTDVRIIEPESIRPVPASSPPTIHPRLRRTHPAARKAKPVRMQIFVRFAFCHPPDPTRSSENQPVQESVTARLRSGAQVLVERFVRLFQSALLLSHITVLSSD